MKKDKILGLLSIGMAIVLLILTLFTVDSKIRIEGDPGPRMFPYIISGMFGLSGIVLLCRKDPGKDKVYLTREEWKRLLILFGVLCAYILVIYLLGFVIATCALLYVVSRMFAEGKNVKKLSCIIFAVATTAIIYFAFRYGLKVYLPNGLIPSMIM